MRQRTITYSKGKARERRAKLQKVEDKLKECTEKCDIDPNSGNLEELECLQTEYDQLYDYITQGAIIRSRATWYEMGEKNFNCERQKPNLWCFLQLTVRLISIF